LIAEPVAIVSTDTGSVRRERQACGGVGAIRLAIIADQLRDHPILACCDRRDVVTQHVYSPPLADISRGRESPARLLSRISEIIGR